MSKKMMKVLLALLVVVGAVGALNWGLTGLFDFNLVEKLLGSMPVAEKAVYALIGAAGIFGLYKFFIKK